MTDPATSGEDDFIHPELIAILAAADPTGEKLKEYWTEGEGAGKIRWGTPGDFDRCVRHLAKYIADPKGYCSDMHERATGFRPGKAPTEQKAAMDEVHSKVNVSKGAKKTEAGAMAELRNVEIARVGEWHLKSGKLNVTPQMLVDAAAYGNRAGARPAPLKIGHGDPRFDGEPALGWLQNLRVEGTGDDSVLVGDILDMPQWLAQAAEKHWPYRSMEGWTDYQADDGRTYAMVVDGLALLGVTPPGMSSLRSLRDVPQALGIAASGRIAATLNPQTPDPDDGAGSSTTTKEYRMDPVKIREGLGLTPDASDEDVTKALVAAGLAPTATPPTSSQTPPEPAPSDPPDNPEPGTGGTTPETAHQQPVAAGTMVIDASAWTASQERIRRLEATEARRRVEERDQILAQAVADGKFAPARKGHWEKLWASDPEGTREVVAGLTKNVVPVDLTGEMGTGEDSLDEEFRGLFPPTEPAKGN